MVTGLCACRLTTPLGTQLAGGAVNMTEFMAMMQQKQDSTRTMNAPPPSTSVSAPPRQLQSSMSQLSVTSTETGVDAESNVGARGLGISGQLTTSHVGVGVVESMQMPTRPKQPKQKRISEAATEDVDDSDDGVGVGAGAGSGGGAGASGAASARTSPRVDKTGIVAAFAGAGAAAGYAGEEKIVYKTEVVEREVVVEKTVEVTAQRVGCQRCSVYELGVVHRVG